MLQVKRDENRRPSIDIFWSSNIKTRNVAIANALQLEAARATQALSRFNYDAMPSLKSLNLSIAVL